mgnify:CR=1 FL=1
MNNELDSKKKEKPHVQEEAIVVLNFREKTT